MLAGREFGTDSGDPGFGWRGECNMELIPALIASLTVKRQNQEWSAALWGDNAERKLQRLVVVVVKLDGDIDFTAYGIDPAQTPEDPPVFERKVPAANLGMFLEIVVDGEAPVSLVGTAPLANSVDVTTTPPPSPGPKVRLVIEYAIAVDKCSMDAEPLAVISDAYLQDAVQRTA